MKNAIKKFHGRVLSAIESLRTEMKREKMLKEAASSFVSFCTVQRAVENATRN